TPALEAIIVVNQNPDITAYRAWQDDRFTENGLLDHPRCGIFALWSAMPSVRCPGRAELTQVFVHSKVATIDDRWATIGTANIDGASLHSYGDDFRSWLGRATFRRVRNYDLNVALHDATTARRVRRELARRHLGGHGDERLSDWRRIAAQNAAMLASGAPM